MINQSYAFEFAFGKTKPNARYIAHWNEQNIYALDVASHTIHNCGSNPQLWLCDAITFLQRASEKDFNALVAMDGDVLAAIHPDYDGMVRNQALILYRRGLLDDSIEY